MTQPTLGGMYGGLSTIVEQQRHNDVIMLLVEIRDLLKAANDARFQPKESGALSGKPERE